MHPHRRMRQDSHLSLWTIVLYTEEEEESDTRPYWERMKPRVCQSSSEGCSICDLCDVV